MLGCGGDSYYALSNIEFAMDSVGADNLDFLLIPRVSEGESSLALDVIDAFSPEDVYKRQALCRCEVRRVRKYGSRLGASRVERA